jgi:hypothetical protein
MAHFTPLLRLEKGSGDEVNRSFSLIFGTFLYEIAIVSSFIYSSIEKNRSFRATDRLSL